MSAQQVLRRYRVCVPKWCEANYGPKCTGGCVDFFDTQSSTQIAPNAGKARTLFLHELWDCYYRADVSFADVRVISLGVAEGIETEGMLRIRSCYSDVPPLHVGMAIEIDGRPYVLYDADGAYLHVIAANGHTTTAHPTWKVNYAPELAQMAPSEVQP